jgi:hypothetical protein
MCLGIWIDPDETTDTLALRAVEAAGRSAAA